MWTLHKQFQDLILFIILCTCYKNFISLISVHSHPPLPYTVFHCNISSKNPYHLKERIEISIPLLHSISNFSLISETSQFSLKQTAKVLWSVTIKFTSVFKGYFKIFKFIIFSGPNLTVLGSIAFTKKVPSWPIWLISMPLDRTVTKIVHFHLSNISCIILHNFPLQKLCKSAVSLGYINWLHSHLTKR